MMLDHIQLAMPEGGEEEARRFFIEILDFTEETKPEPLASRGGCWFRHGSVVLHLGVEKHFSPQRKAHPAFLAENLEELADRLESHGYPVEWDESLPDRRRFYSIDPFENRLEFLRDGDGFSQRC